MISLIPFSDLRELNVHKIGKRLGYIQGVQDQNLPKEMATYKHRQRPPMTANDRQCQKMKTKIKKKSNFTVKFCVTPPGVN